MKEVAKENKFGEEEGELRHDTYTIQWKTNGGAVPETPPTAAMAYWSEYFDSGNGKLQKNPGGHMRRCLRRGTLSGARGAALPWTPSGVCGVYGRHQ